MIHLSIKMLPSSNSGLYTYNFASLYVEVKVGREFRLRDNYSFMVYSENLMLMAGATTWNSGIWESFASNEGRTFSMVMHGCSVWMPGKYFFLVTVKDGSVTRFDLTLDKNCCFTVGEARRCEYCSVEGVLARQIFLDPANWRNLCCSDGLAQLRHRLLEWLMVKDCSPSEGNDVADKCATNRFNLLVTTGGSNSYNTGEYVARQGLKTMLEMCNSTHKLKIIMGDCSEFYDSTDKNPYHVLDALFDESVDSDLGNELPPRVFVFFNLRHMSNHDVGSRLLHRLHDVMPDERHYAIFCGSQGEISALLERDSELKQYFPEKNRLAQEPLTLDEVVHGFFMDSRLNEYEFSPAAVEKVCTLFSGLSRQGELSDSNHYVERLEFYLTLEQCCIDADLEDKVIKARDIDEAMPVAKITCNESKLDELDEMIGLEDIKRSIVTLSNRRCFFEKRRKLGLNTSGEGTYHAIFTGNPGTGKTTVAKMMGRIYRSLGLLSKGDVICVDRAKMVGEYIGQTEQIMKQLLSEACGNVLFVDEAYTLYRQNNERDFGHVVVESLLEVLSKDNPDMIIIFAGYKQEMDELMTMNPGLEGRFPYKFHFEDYNADQLMQIGMGILNKDQYVLTDEASCLLWQVIRNTVAHRTRTFANARWMVQFIRNGIIPAMANRLIEGGYAVDKETYQTIVAEDIHMAETIWIGSKVDKPLRNTVGFRA